MVASRTQALIDRREILAHGGRAFVESVKTMAVSGMLDRQKMVDWVRIVSLFNKATGKDTSHGLLDMVHHLLSDIPLAHEERLQQQEKEQYMSGGRAQATDTRPPQLDDLACYMISRGGHGAETMFCSEAMKQLFISTDELTMTVQETGLTSISVWATFTTREGLATLNRAASTVFLQKGTDHVEVELECLTRTGLLVACAGTVSFRVCDNGESTLVLSLTVKQDASPRASASSSFSSRKHAVAEKGEAEGGAGMSSRTRRTTYSSERLAALASKREYEEEQKQQQQQQQQQSRRRRPRSPDEAPLPSCTTSTSSSPSTSSSSSSTSASSFSSSSSSSSSPVPPSSRPPPQRIAVSCKRRKTPSTVSWSHEGPPHPEAICGRLATCSTHLPLTTEEKWSNDKKDKVFACAATLEQQQQQQQQQQQHLKEVGRGDGEEEHNDWRGPWLPQQPRQLHQQQQHQQEVALAPACLLPSAFSALVSLPGVPVPLIFTENSTAESSSSSSSSDASTEHEDEEQQQHQVQQQQQVQQLKKDGSEDDVWAWANSIWEEADGMQQTPLDLGTGLEAGVVGGGGIEGGMQGGAEGGVVGGVEDPSLWLMLEQQEL